MGSSFIPVSEAVWFQVTSFGDSEHKVDLRPFVSVRLGPNGLGVSSSSLLCLSENADAVFARDLTKIHCNMLHKAFLMKEKVATLSQDTIKRG
jgi:hypothetical protein